MQDRWPTTPLQLAAQLGYPAAPYIMTTLIKHSNAFDLRDDAELHATLVREEQCSSAALLRTQLRRALRTWHKASGVTAENEDGPPEIASIGLFGSKSHGALEIYDAETSLLCARLALLLPWLRAALPMVRII